MQESFNQTERTRRTKSNKPLAGFPSAYHQILLAFQLKQSDTKKPNFTLKFPDGTAAQAFRFGWYDFKKAVQAQRPEDAGLIASIVCKIRAETVEFSHRDQGVINLLAEEQLSQQFAELNLFAESTAAPAAQASPLDDDKLYENYGRGESEKALTPEQAMMREMGIEPGA